MADDIKKLEKQAKANPESVEDVGRWVQARERQGEVSAPLKGGRLKEDKGMATYYRIKLGENYVAGYSNSYSYGYDSRRVVKLRLSKTGKVFESMGAVDNFIAEVIGRNDIDSLKNARLVEYKTVVFDTRELAPQIKESYTAYLEKQKQAAIQKLERLKQKHATELAKLDFKLKKKRNEL